MEYDSDIKAPLTQEETRRQSGRPPKNKRFRPRSKYSDPKESKVICKKCGKNGNNRKTCEIRKYLEALQEQLKKKQEMERSTVGNVTNNNTSDTEERNTVTAITHNISNEGTDENNASGAIAHVPVPYITTIEHNNVSATISSIPATVLNNNELAVHDTVPVHEPIRNNNEFAIHNTVSIDVIKAMDPGYETTIL